MHANTSFTAWKNATESAEAAVTGSDIEFGIARDDRIDMRILAHRSEAFGLAAHQLKQVDSGNSIRIARMIVGARYQRRPTGPVVEHADPQVEAS